MIFVWWYYRCPIPGASRHVQQERLLSIPQLLSCAHFTCGGTITRVKRATGHAASSHTIRLFDPAKPQLSILRIPFYTSYGAGNAPETVCKPPLQAFLST